MTDFSILSEFFRLVFDKWSISMHLRDRARGQGLADGQRQLTLTLTQKLGRLRAPGRARGRAGAC